MRQETVTIGEHEYLLTQLDSEQGIRASAKLINALAPSLSKLPEEGLNITPAQGAAMLEPLLRDPNLAETVISLCKTFSERSALLGEKEGEVTQTPLSRVWKTHFADRQDEMYLWLFECIKLSMSSLFRGARSIDALLRAMQKKAGVQSPSPNPAASSGQSGE
jgi:hypothetical protein